MIQEHREKSHPNVFVDLLERVLDKGIVIDAWMRVRVAGIDLVDLEKWAVVSPLRDRPVLFIIATDKVELFEKWAAAFPDLASRGAVFLDRRRADRRRQERPVDADRRQADRRRRAIDRELQLTGLAVVPLPVRAGGG